MMKILAIFRLGTKKAQDKLIPLLDSQLVERLFLVRHSKVPIQSEKLSQVLHHSGLDDTGGKQSVIASLRNTWLCFYNGLHATRREQPDALLSFQLIPYGILTWVIAKLTRKRVILSLVGSDYNKWVKSRWLGLSLQVMLKHTDAVTIFGEEERLELIRYGIAPPHVFTLLNPVDTTIFVPDPQVPKEYDLIFVGYLRFAKRVDLLLQALAEIHMLRPETTLIIVGNGSERTNLEQLTKTLQLNDRVNFLGWSDQIIDHLRRSRILVLLSEHEGLPVVVLEAMSTGLPAIVTDVGSNRSIVRDGQSGYIVPSPAAPTLVAARILELLTDPDKYQEFSAEALKIRETHGIPQATQNWERILTSIREQKALGEGKA